MAVSRAAVQGVQDNTWVQGHFCHTNAIRLQSQSPVVIPPCWKPVEISRLSRLFLRVLDFVFLVLPVLVLRSAPVCVQTGCLSALLDSDSMISCSPFADLSGHLVHTSKVCATEQPLLYGSLTHPALFARRKYNFSS